MNRQINSFQNMCDMLNWPSGQEERFFATKKQLKIAFFGWIERTPKKSQRESFYALKIQKI